MIAFKLGKGKSIEERKVALISQIKQINGKLYNIRRLYCRDHNYAPMQIGECTGSFQVFEGHPPQYQ